METSDERHQRGPPERRLNLLELLATERELDPASDRRQARPLTQHHIPHPRARSAHAGSSRQLRPVPAARAQLRQPSREFAEAVHLAVRDGETIAHLAHENVTDRSRHDPPTARHAAPSAQHVLGSTAMGRYEQRYGVLAEGPMDGWQDQPEAAEISAEEFERLWTEARRALGGSA
ncbi:hypothetical protein [Streptomyces sp. NPDC017964]|uniref:hypothetical protein n=1 Tax=Streptomyces sp. NPDC017964 TaxID=3365022 RepID=UPI0037A7A772